jgi:hypothetical protein
MERVGKTESLKENYLENYVNSKYISKKII